MPGRIISFGIVMSSTWRNASGDLIGAATSMQIQAATVKPEFYVSTIKESGSGSTPHWALAPSSVAPASTARRA